MLRKNRRTVARCNPPNKMIHMSMREALNKKLILKRLGGDRVILANLARLFLDGLDGVLSNMRNAISNRNCRDLAFASHALKGSVSNFGETNAFTVLKEMEVMAEAGNLDEVAELYPILEDSIDHLKPFIEACATAG